MKSSAIVLILLLFVPCASIASDTDKLAARVSALVNQCVDARTEEQAFSELEALGPEAVPYIVGHLKDERPLPLKTISLTNHSPQAFEGVRRYVPEVVHDALSAVLNQVAGQHFEFVYNGSTPEQRKSNRQQWEAWCTRTYPAKASVCGGT